MKISNAMRTWTIMAIALLLIVTCMRRYGEKRQAKSSKLLRNNVVLSGRILNIKLSLNHNFGIILIQLSSATSPTRNKNHPSNTKFPYLIWGNKSEIYTRVPDGINLGDSIRLESNKEVIYYYDKVGKQKTEEYISIIEDASNLKFIKENSNLK